MASTWAAKYWRSFFGMKSGMAAADAAGHQGLPYKQRSKNGFRGAQSWTRNFSRGVPVLLGMGVGISTAFQHLVHSPGVNLSKKKRLSFPELDVSGDDMESAGKRYGICRKLGQLNYSFIGEHSDAASSTNPYQQTSGKLEIEPRPELM